MSRLRAERLCNYDEFTSMVQSLMKEAWGKNWGTFCEAFPNGTDPNNVKLPAITYTMKSKKPGLVGKSTYEIKPRYRESYVETDGDEGHQRAVTVYGQIFDCLIVFEVWEETNTKVDEMAKQFEDFMRAFTGYFKQQGVGELLFVEMKNEREGQMRDPLMCRHYKYMVRLEEQTLVYEDVIQKVIGRVQAAKQLPDDSNHTPYIDFE